MIWIFYFLHLIKWAISGFIFKALHRHYLRKFLVRVKEGAVSLKAYNKCYYFFTIHIWTISIRFFCQMCCIIFWRIKCTIMQKTKKLLRFKNYHIRPTRWHNDCLKYVCSNNIHSKQPESELQISFFFKTLNFLKTSGIRNIESKNIYWIGVILPLLRDDITDFC